MANQEDYREDFKSLGKLLGENSSFMNVANNYVNYENAAKGPLMHAAKLLRVGSTIEGNSTMDWARHIKFNSWIDLFHIKSQSTTFREEIIGNGTISVSESTYHNLLGMHQENEDFPKFLNRSEIVEWASNDFYPIALQQLNLSKDQIHFLERMADFINRAEFFPSIGGFCRSRSNSDNLDIELIVRSLELRAAINDTDVLESFSSLDQYHHKYASPLVASYLNANNQTSHIPFSEQYLIGENETCEEVGC